jgi:GNAT superfamily N-acetyltransferase
MDAEVYRTFYPENWRVNQQKAVEKVCASEDTNVWIAIEAVSTVGFVAVKLHSEDRMGEVYMVAVDPDFQTRGIGAALIEFALDWMKAVGMSVAMVETGCDAGHAPARHTYEKTGFVQWPVARYFKKL